MYNLPGKNSTFFKKKKVSRNVASFSLFRKTLKWRQANISKKSDAGVWAETAANESSFKD
jgi:hypothetical protein